MPELMSRMQHTPTSIRTLDAHLPESLDRIITKCLQADPKSRYATTTELVADLEALAPDGHRLIPSHPVTTSRTTVLVLAAIFAAVLGGGGWWIWHMRGGVVSAPVQHEPVSVLIANFENKANLPLFDGLIEQALGVSIEGASFVTNYSRREAVRIAQQINPNASLDDKNARLVATREGINRILTGSISSDGSKYALTVQIGRNYDGRERGLYEDCRGAGRISSRSNDHRFESADPYF